MTARLADAVSLALALDRHTLPPGDAAAAEAQQRFATLITHLASLLHAVMAQGLRRDPDLNNLVIHSLARKEPPLVRHKWAPGHGKEAQGAQAHMRGARLARQLRCWLVVPRSCQQTLSGGAAVSQRGNVRSRPLPANACPCPAGPWRPEQRQRQAA
jgi:hypothetical protein